MHHQVQVTTHILLSYIRNMANVLNKMRNSVSQVGVITTIYVNEKNVVKQNDTMLEFKESMTTVLLMNISDLSFRIKG